ncbi:AMP-binding protein [Rhodococcus antarcticus]|uniref:AMP-binding protein n=1 Tax=Rhodococcus antarcticus TaxID=2987751 RepID=A0ABY6NWW6_9NOCA|nr:AMP-binding protein [Rhodococcus antarcticus]UZJ23889.1 AMP-binding protein [Rhodococcus antarcticus]
MTSTPVHPGTTSTRILPPGLPEHLDVPAVDVGAVLRGAARRYGEHTAFHQDGAEITYAALLAEAAQVAHGLRAQGIVPGDVVAVHMPNCLDYPAVYYGILMAGAVFSPTNPLLPPAELAFQLRDSAAVAVVTWGAASGVLAAVREQVPARLVVTVDASLPDSLTLAELRAGQPSTAPDGRPQPGELAHLAYTGGTTGRSKGVRLTHRHVVTNVVQSACWTSGSTAGLDAEGDLLLDQVGSAQEWPTRLGTGVSVTITPWFHAMGVIGYLNVPVLTGYTCVIHQRFDPGAYLADVERFGATMIGGAPPVFVALLRHPDAATRDLSTVLGLSSGAAPLPVTVIEALRVRFPDAVIGEGYGLTEVTMVATMNPSWRSGVRKVGTVGVPAHGTEVRLLDPYGAEVPTGGRGEVYLRGPQVMEGYHERPDATAEVLVDGWLRTGDVGVLDADGYLSIVDRAKDMLLYKGYNVFPRELEEILHTHPGVAGAAVVGRPDEEAGELPVAFVALVPGAEVTAEGLREHVNAQVVHYKKLREVHLVDAIPVSAAGKVLRRELRDGLTAHT